MASESWNLATDIFRNFIWQLVITLNNNNSDAEDVTENFRLTLLLKQFFISVPHDQLSAFIMEMSNTPAEAHVHGLPPSTAISYAGQGELLKRARAAPNWTLFNKKEDNDEQQHIAYAYLPPLRNLPIHQNH